MAKLVTKWRYLKPDAARHAQAYIRYIATREGVEKYVEENGARPAVQAQRVLVEKLLRDFPDARRSFEYEDYARRPTVRNASEFITRTLEEHLELFDARSNYVSYIAQRPRVQRSGAHGLFTQEEDAPDLNAAARAVSEHDGNIWTCGVKTPPACHTIKRTHGARCSVPMRRRSPRGSMCRSGRSIGAEPSTTKRTILMCIWSVMRTVCKSRRSQRRGWCSSAPSSHGRYSGMNWTQYISASHRAGTNCGICSAHV